jgi:hypothetical protein
MSVHRELPLQGSSCSQVQRTLSETGSDAWYPPDKIWHTCNICEVHFVANMHVWPTTIENNEGCTSKRVSQ